MNEQRKTIISKPGLALHQVEKPSKILIFIAIIATFLLPYLLVTSFPNKHHILSRHTNLPQENTKTLQPTLDIEAPLPSKISEPPISITPPPTQETKLPPKSQKASERLQKIKVNKKDTIEKILTRIGFSKLMTQQLLKEIQHTQQLKNLKAGQTIQYTRTDNTITELIIPLNALDYLVILKKNGHFKSTRHSYPIQTKQHFITATVTGSLYTTAQKNHISYALIRQMIDMFESEIHLEREVKSGDQFTILYKAYYVDNQPVKSAEILIASFHTRRKTHTAIRHQHTTGQINYYSQEGKSLKKAFLRYPVRFSHISSGFSISRYHPVLHYRRAHRGVDLAASIGTPILATGDGRIEMIGRQHGYGNMIKIKHNGTYSSIYAHMLRFQKGLKRGAYVTRGQIIGYVGQTGLASGPHCHYEFHVNNIARNPATIELPRANNLTGRELAHFKQNAQTLIAQVKLFEHSRLAANDMMRNKKNISSSFSS